MTLFCISVLCARALFECIQKRTVASCLTSFIYLMFCSVENHLHEVLLYGVILIYGVLVNVVI